MIDVAELQGGIVRGYGQRFGFARHLFARVREPRAARAFLAALADPVTTEEEWAQHPATTLNVALSFRALGALELPPWILDGFPQEVRDGMAARADRLGDDPATWEDDLRELEVLVVVHAQSAEALEAEAGRWELGVAAGDSGLELAHVQQAGLLGEQREHFGFTDGFSQPAIEGVAREDIRGQGIPYKRAPWWPLNRTQWRAVKPGEFVLDYEDEDGGPPSAPPAPFDRNASFMVGASSTRTSPASGRSSPSRPTGCGSTRSSLRPRWSGAGATAARWRCARTAPTRRWATTRSAPTTSATATTSSGCAARAARTCGARTRAMRSAGRAG